MSVKLFLSFSSFFCITFIHDFRLTCCLLLQLISHWSLNKAVWSPKTRTHLPSWCAWVSTTAQQNKTSPRLLLLPLCCLKIFLFFSLKKKLSLISEELICLPWQTTCTFEDQSLQRKLESRSSDASHSNTVVLISTQENMTRLVRLLRYEPLAGNVVGNGSWPPP